MQWWDTLVAWLTTESGRLVLFGGVVPFVAILTAGLLAAWIARGSVRAVLGRHDREARAAVIGALVDSARQASMWNSSSPGERVLIERSIAEADLALRLLPTSGARLSAEWAAHEIAGLRRASAAFSLEFDEPLAAVRDRLVAWHRRPRRARKLFEADLLRWRAEDAAQAPADVERILPPSEPPTASVRRADDRPAAPAGPLLPTARVEHSSDGGRPGRVEPPTDDEFAVPAAGAGRAAPGA